MSIKSLSPGPAQIEADLIRQGGAFTGVTDDPLSNDIIIFATLPLQRQSSKGYRQSLTELSRGSAICYAELDRFAPEDIFENNSLSTYAEFLLTPILDLGVSELKAFERLGHRLLPFEGGQDLGRGGDGKDVNNAIDFDDFYQYRKMMSHCFVSKNEIFPKGSNDPFHNIYRQFRRIELIEKFSINIK